MARASHFCSAMLLLYSFLEESWSVLFILLGSNIKVRVSPLSGLIESLFWE